MTKQPQLTEQTRRNLLEAFWTLYRERRIDQITVKEIVARAGYNRGTFYEYFRDVYHCLEGVEVQCLPRFDELPPLPGGKAPSADFIGSFVDLYQERMGYYDVLLGDRGDPSFQRRLIDCVKAAILGGLRAGATIDRVELDLMLEYVLSGMIGIMRYCFHGQPARPRSELIEITYRVLGGDVMRRIRDELSVGEPPGAPKSP